MKNIPFAAYIKILVGLFFIAVGLFYVIYPFGVDFLPVWVMRAIGAIILVRGAFRAYFAFKEEWLDKNDE